MHTSDELAVIICTRDRPAMLRRCLASVTASTPPEIDVLVVNSAAVTSETRETAEAAGVRVVRSEIPGLSIARNLGLASTSRSLVVFTDDDCLVAPGWTQALLDAFTDDTVGAVTGSMLDDPAAGPDDNGPARRTLTRTVDGLDAGHGALMAFDRRLVLDIGGFDDVLGAGQLLAGAEDLDMFCRVLRAGRTVVFEPRSAVQHVHTREGEAYATLHRGYGLGLGGMLNKWVRTHPGTGAALTAIVLRRAVAQVVHTLRRPRDRRRASASQALLRGVVDGFWIASRIRLDGDVFRQQPPTPLPLPDGVGDS